MPNARELAIDQIGAYFPRQHTIAPVAYVFEHHQPEHNFGGGGKPSASTALGPALQHDLVDDVHQLRIVEQAVGVAHPVFPPAFHGQSEQSLREQFRILLRMAVTNLNHAASGGSGGRRVTGPRQGAEVSARHACSPGLTPRKYRGRMELSARRSAVTTRVAAT